MNTTDLGRYGSYIDGEQVAADSSFPVLDPTTETPIAEVAAGGDTHVDAGLNAASRTAPEWEAVDPSERSRLLWTVADAVSAATDRLARIETLETGRSIAASEEQAEKTVQYFEYYAGMADKIEGETIPLGGDPELLDYTVREPLGVTGHIVPWNAAMVLAARSIAPALAAGNTVVAKASGEAPLSLLELARVVSEAGLPDGVCNVVAGLDGTAGKQLVADERTDSIDFTGSTAIGTDVMTSAADTLSPVHLELGGKSPNIVFPDADLERAARDSVKAFWNAGQTCFAPTRLFVHEEVYETFVSLLVDQTEAMSVGPGTENHDIGPLITADALERVDGYVRDAVEAGGTVLTGGEPLDRRGYFYEPTVIDGVDDDAPISCDEVFGPVLTVDSFEAEAEAVRRANDTEYGLYALAWTDDLSRAHRLADRLEAGTVLINNYLFASPLAPSGGYKKSGIGRAKGQQAIRNYTQLKNVAIAIDDD